MNIPVDNSEYLKHLSAGLESSHEESKKELSQLHRFANSQYRLYPRIGEVREALKSLQPEQLLEVLQKRVDHYFRPEAILPLKSRIYLS